MIDGLKAWVHLLNEGQELLRYDLCFTRAQGDSCQLASKQKLEDRQRLSVFLQTIQRLVAKPQQNMAGALLVSSCKYLQSREDYC